MGKNLMKIEKYKNSKKEGEIVSVRGNSSSKLFLSLLQSENISKKETSFKIFYYKFLKFN